VFLSNERIKEWYPLEKRYFAAIGSSSVKTVADRYRQAVVMGFLVLSTSMTLNTHFESEFHKMAGDRPRQCANRNC